MQARRNFFKLNGGKPMLLAESTPPDRNKVQPYLLKISGDKFPLSQIFSAGPAKGQLFSEGNFDVFKSPKKRNKFLKYFCPNL